MENIRNIFFYGNYAKEFIKEQRFPIQKKTRKTPTKEIQKVLLLMEEYFTNKR